MLQEHRERNRPVHPPNMRTLGVASSTQRRLQQAASFDDENSSDNDNGQAQSELDEENVTTHQRARRNSKIPHGGTIPKPTTLKYYSKPWQSMLMLAKNNMRRHVALVNAFPERDHHLCEAENILIKTITEYKEEHVLDDSKFSPFLYSYRY